MVSAIPAKTPQAQTPPTEHRLKFTVDAALLRELGERLVGKAHIALAELVKNSYDADATEVVIRFASDKIEIIDNGQGMSFTEFQNYWMRIGSPHKQEKTYSRKFERPVTGSKGVGRLSVQFLASKMSLVTSSDRLDQPELSVSVDWGKAISAGDLTQAEAICIQRPRQQIYPGSTAHGTQIILTSLAEQWDSSKLRELAREIWALQPPFAEDLSSDNPHRFQISIESRDQELIAPAQQQLRAHLDIWDARLIGRLPSAKSSGNSTPAQLRLEFSDGEVVETSYSILSDEEKYGSLSRNLDEAEFEIRIFKLEHKQRFGIRVGEARDYLNKFGGVHIYDAGFHLPYYGPETDWLRIEIDHSHRLSTSALLPKPLQQPKGMNNLPTNSRIFGVVRVNSAHERARFERSAGSDRLMISVTRDRLIENSAYANLRVFVRWALDFYAMETTKRRIKELAAIAPIEPAYSKVVRIEKIIEDNADRFPKAALARIRSEVQQLEEDTSAEVRTRQAEVGLLGALATAGIAAVAFEHEFRRQLIELKMVSDELSLLVRSSPKIEKLAGRLRNWISRVESTRRVFSPLASEEDRSKRARLRTRPIMEQTASRVEALVRQIPIDTSELDGDMRFPEGTHAEWSAIFQNVFMNAANAMLDSKTKKIKVISEIRGRDRAVLILDTGSGVNLKSAHQLFDPFHRKSKISPERARLGLGGTGLGLTIVKMVAENVGCKVDFVPPPRGYRTAFRLSWRERQ